MMPTPPGRSVIVGAGLMGHWHADAVRRIGERVGTVVDVDPSKAEALARRVGARAATTLTAGLADRPFAVHVCTPVESHAALASQALEAGAHVLVEKPFARSSGEAREVLTLAATRGRVVSPVHQFLFQPGVRRTQHRLPQLGPVRHVDFVACSAGADSSPDRRREVALDILPHPLSLVARVLAVPLGAVHWQVLVSGPGELRIVGQHGGVSISLLVSLAGRPTRNTLRIIGEGGTAHLDLFHGFAVFEAGTVSRARKIARPLWLGTATLAAAAANLALRTFRGEPAYPGLRELVRRFYLAGRGSGPAPIAAEEVIEVSAAVERLAGEIRRVSDAAGSGGGAKRPPDPPLR